jgi:pyruvate formate lyase activating enzyme
MACEGQIVLTSYGRNSGLCVDPIEKKPLNHFYPGSKVLSFGTAGCNLGCKFCQNWRISKSRTMETLSSLASPQQIVDIAIKNRCSSVAFTYNDPVIFIEYADAVAKLCRQHGIHAVAVSAGYINPEPRVDFFRHISAANIDLKGFSESFYRKLCAGYLAPVLDTLLYLKQETQVWFEITNLLIPEENDSEAELNAMCDWIVTKLGSNVPLHFSAFHPDFKLFNRPRTPLATLQRAYRIAKSAGINHVYLGNVQSTDGQTSFCSQCGEPLIIRQGYQILGYNLTAVGCCPSCQTPLAGRFTEQFGTA